MMRNADMPLASRLAALLMAFTPLALAQPALAQEAEEPVLRSPAGQVGERQDPTNQGKSVNPNARLDTRIATRVSSRISTRLDRNNRLPSTQAGAEVRSAAQQARSNPSNRRQVPTSQPIPFEQPD